MYILPGAVPALELCHVELPVGIVPDKLFIVNPSEFDVHPSMFVSESDHNKNFNWLYFFLVPYVHRILTSHRHWKSEANSVRNCTSKFLIIVASKQFFSL